MSQDLEVTDSSKVNAELLRERIKKLEKDYADLSAHHNQHCICIDIY